MKTLSLDDSLSGALALFAALVFFSVTAVQAALFLALILLLVKKYRQGTLRGAGRELAAHPLFVPWMVYLGVCLLTALTAYYPAKGLGQLNSDFLKYVCLSALLLSIRAGHLPRLAAVYTAAAAVSALFGVYEALSPLLSGGQVVRAGVFMNAVRYGEAMTVALLLPLSLLMPAPAGRGRLLYSAAAALAFAAVVLTQTRGAWLGLAAGLASMFVFSPPARKRLAVFAALAAAALTLAAAFSPSIRGRVTAMTSLNRGDFSGNSSSTGINVRLELWKLGFKMLEAHPVTGVGPDNVKKVFKKFHPAPFPEEGIYGTLNSIYVHQAAERGLLGLGALLLLFLAMLRFAHERFKATASPYALWALCALPAFYVMNLTEISFQHVHTSYAVFLALAFAAAAGEEAA